jgi:hypothetical protein
MMVWSTIPLNPPRTDGCVSDDAHAGVSGA